MKMISACKIALAISREEESDTTCTNMDGFVLLTRPVAAVTVAANASVVAANTAVQPLHPVSDATTALPTCLLQVPITREGVPLITQQAIDVLLSKGLLQQNTIPSAAAAAVQGDSAQGSAYSTGVAMQASSAATVDSVLLSVCEAEMLTLNSTLADDIQLLKTWEDLPRAKAEWENTYQSMDQLQQHLQQVETQIQQELIQAAAEAEQAAAASDSDHSTMLEFSANQATTSSNTAESSVSSMGRSSMPTSPETAVHMSTEDMQQQVETQGSSRLAELRGVQLELELKMSDLQQKQQDVADQQESMQQQIKGIKKLAVQFRIQKKKVLSTLISKLSAMRM